MGVQQQVLCCVRLPLVLDSWCWLAVQWNKRSGYGRTTVICMNQKIPCYNLVLINDNQSLDTLLFLLMHVILVFRMYATVQGLQPLCRLVREVGLCWLLYGDMCDANPPGTCYCGLFHLRNEGTFYHIIQFVDSESLRLIQRSYISSFIVISTDFESMFYLNQQVRHATSLARNGSSPRFTAS